MCVLVSTLPFISLTLIAEEKLDKPLDRSPKMNALNGRVLKGDFFFLL